jgi:hypothetical protein
MPEEDGRLKPEIRAPPNPPASLAEAGQKRDGCAQAGAPRHPVTGKMGVRRQFLTADSSSKTYLPPLPCFLERLSYWLTFCSFPKLSAASLGARTRNETSFPLTLVLKEVDTLREDRFMETEFQDRPAVTKDAALNFGNEQKNQLACAAANPTQRQGLQSLRPACRVAALDVRAKSP